MILTVTLNAALDITYEVDRLTPGATHRVSAAHERAGGKGLNVARVLLATGRDAMATGLAGGAIGARIRAELTAAGIPDELVDMPVESRRTVSVVPSEDHPTSFNEPGRPVPEEAWTAFLDRYRTLLAMAQVVTLSGSLPPGLPDDAYRQLVSLAAQSGLPVVLDSSGPALARALEARPTVVKPNQDELAELTGLGDPLAAAHAVRLRGARRVVASLGDKGLVGLSEDGAWRVALPSPVAGNPTGAGDAAVAALAAGLADGSDWVQSLRWAAALSASAVSRPMAGEVDLDLAATLLGEIAAVPAA